MREHEKQRPGAEAEEEHERQQPGEGKLLAVDKNPTTASAPPLAINIVGTFRHLLRSSGSEWVLCVVAIATF